MILIKLLEDFGKYIELLSRMFAVPEKFSMYWKEVLRQMVDIGVGSLIVVILIAIFIGAVEEDGSGYPDCRQEFYDSFEKMIEVVVESEALTDENPELINLSSWILEDIFSNQYRNGNYSLAKKTLGEGLTRINNAAIQNGYSEIKTDHFILYKQGRVEMQLDNYSAALKYFDLALEGNENGADYYYERSKTQQSLKNYSKSTSDLVIALASLKQQTEYAQARLPHLTGCRGLQPS